MNSLQRLKYILRTLTFLSGAVFFASSASANGLAYDESRNLVYAGFSGTVGILDTSIVSNPTLVSDSIQVGDVVKDLFYDANTQRLYIAANEGDLEIWDVQNPASPQHISTTKVYYFNTETPVVSVAVVGNIAFVSAGYGGMHRLDVSDPTNPVDLSFTLIGGNPSRELVLGDDNSVTLAGPNTVHFNVDSNGNILSSSTNGNHNLSTQVFRDNGTTYSSRSNLLKITGANFVDTGNSIQDIYAQNDIVYIAAGSAGLHLWDLSDKNNPFVIGTDTSAVASSVVVNNNYAYVGVNSGVRIVDVSNPSGPAVVGLFDINSGGVGNISPVANASLSQSVESGSTVTLNGTFSNDPDGVITNYLWEQVSGTAVVLNDANTSTPTFIALYDADQTRLVQQLYFKLTVTDNEGATGSDEVQISVLRNANGDGVIGGGSGGNNVAPIANAGSPISAKSRQRVWLNGSDSFDPDGSIIKYKWKQVSGKSVRLRRSNREQAKFRAPRVRRGAIQLQFELTVTDNNGATDTSIVDVTISK